MPVLDFDDAPVSRPRKNLRLILGVGTIAAVVGVSSTLASSITLNGGGGVEFGQGILTTAACDNSIKVTPISGFSNSDSSASPSPTAARFPVNVIKVEGVDLTPEGWNDSLGGFDPKFNPNLDPEARSWAPGFEQYAGKYFNGTAWVPTCEGKVLLLRAFTNNDDYGYYTVDGSTNSPLWLHRPPGVGGGAFGMAPAPTTPKNAGLGIRAYIIPVSLSDRLIDPIWVTDVFVNAGGVESGSDYNPIGIGGSATNYTSVDYVSDVIFDLIRSNWWTNPSIEIRLRKSSGYTGVLLPLDSRLVDKFTIESTGKAPIGWGMNADESGKRAVLNGS